MRVLLHACCGPCSIVPVEELRGEGFEVVLMWYNPNVQPFREYVRRVRALKVVARALGAPVVWDLSYPLEEWLRDMSSLPTGSGRCALCYERRLRRAAEVARDLGCEFFTTTMLYSPYQKHFLVRDIGERVSADVGLSFLYRDWRSRAPEGEVVAKRMGVYVQGYCGCIFSERDRYWREELLEE